MTSWKNTVAIQNYVTNSIDAGAIGDKQIAGIIGDAPSLYSKSPVLWNAAFDYLGMSAIYLPLDADRSRLGDITAAIRASDRFLGINVTVPHKVRIMDFLDEIDQGAQRVQAVNTIVRTSTGRLVGYNTDGEGFIDSLLVPDPGHSQTFMSSLRRVDVLLLGAGGSARAVAFHLSEFFDGGQLLICNRTAEHAHSLATELRRHGRNASPIDESEIKIWAPKVGLIVNSTTKGQGGVRKLPDGRLMNLEPYSSLASAHPLAISQSDFDNPQTRQQWLRAARADIDVNNQSSMNMAQSIPQNVRFYDLIYHPEETVFLSHGKLTGHQTRNGKAMIVRQAVIACCRHICKHHLLESGKDNATTYQAISELMFASW
ncbi:MAG: shikimate dehydrogenase [Candidatus Binatia bacterium]